jgi:hydrogenase/urease accessory protein HupE
VIHPNLKLLLFILLGSIVCESKVYSHPFLQNSLWLKCESGRVLLAIDVSEKEIQIAHGNQTEATGGKVSKQAVAEHASYVLNHLKLRASGVSLSGVIRSVKDPVSIQNPENTFYQYEYEFILLEKNPSELTLEQSMLKEWEYSTGLPWSVSYVVRFKSDAINLSTFLLTSKPLIIPTGLYSDKGVKTMQEVLPHEQSRLHIAKDYFKHGIMHILTGYDHLLFISGLVVVTLTLWEMVSVILAFTLAHTLTLILCVFGIFRLPSSIVEPVIALSIIFIALENVYWPRRTHSIFRLGVAFGFGLIHGLGFAGGLLDAMAGLPPLGMWISLASFSCGVECGHQLVVLPLFAAFYFLRKRCEPQSLGLVISGVSWTIAMLGCYYLIIAINEQYFIGK